MHRSHGWQADAFRRSRTLFRTIASIWMFPSYCADDEDPPPPPASG
jgi:hypothetical protein